MPLRSTASTTREPGCAVSPKAKSAVVHLLRIAVTAAALVLVYRMIQFHDLLQIRYPQPSVPIPRENPILVREWEVQGPETRVRFLDGTQGTFATVDVTLVRPGFLRLFAATNKPMFVVMMAAGVLPILFMALRWWLLLRGHGFDVPLGRIFLVTYAGAFFNNFLPGAVGGDLTKAILASSGEDRKAAVAGTVILDRLIGLATMILMASIALTPFLGRFSNPGLASLIYGLLGAMIVGYVVYFSPLFRKLVGVLPFRRVVDELDGVFRSAKEKKGLVAQAVGLSLLAQVTGILVIYGLAVAMGIPGIGVWMFFIFEPIIFIVTALPISVGGWGVQEVLYRELFGRFGGVDPNQAIALSVLYKLSLILMSIPGGVLFATGAARRRSAPSAAPGPQGF